MSIGNYLTTAIVTYAIAAYGSHKYGQITKA